MALSDAIRQEVRLRADGLCEYCRISERLTHYAHQVDHIIPHRHGGDDELDNLAWACFRCNNAKGTDIATYDFETGLPVFLYHPRQLQWDEQFVVLSTGVIQGHYALGRATARLLRMNSPERIELRRILIKEGLW
jgi:hypothetical protein